MHRESFRRVGGGWHCFCASGGLLALLPRRVVTVRASSEVAGDFVQPRAPRQQFRRWFAHRREPRFLPRIIGVVVVAQQRAGVAAQREGFAAEGFRREVEGVAGHGGSDVQPPDPVKARFASTTCQILGAIESSRLGARAEHLFAARRLFPALQILRAAYFAGAASPWASVLSPSR